MKKNKIILFIFIAYACVSSVLFLLSMALQQYAGYRSQHRQEMAQRWQAQAAEYAQSEHLHSDWQNIEKDYQRFLAGHFYRFANYDDFRHDIKSLVEGQATRVAFSSFQANSAGKDFTMFRFKINASGTYLQIKKLLYNLENQQRMILIKAIAFLAKETELTAEFTMEAYLVN